MICKKSRFLFFILFSCLNVHGATVVLDTGHNILKPGVITFDGKSEYEYNKLYVDYLDQFLRANGVDVQNVRQDGEDVSLTSRTKFTTGKSLFLSIHHDSMQQTWIDSGFRDKYSGFSLFVSTKNKFVGQSIACASMIGAQLKQVNEYPSYYHSVNYPGENKKLIDVTNGVHIYDNLVVLKTASSPAVLLEVGVIINNHEALRLRKLDIIQRHVNAVGNGILECIR